MIDIDDTYGKPWKRYISLKSLFIEKYVDQDDWRTIEWHNLNDFLNRFNQHDWRIAVPTTTTSIMTTSSIGSLSTFWPVTTDWNVLHSLDITRDISNQINAMKICPDKEFTPFKLLIQKYFEVYERLLFHAKIDSLHLNMFMEKFRVLSKNILTYKELFVATLEHEVNGIFSK